MVGTERRHETTRVLLAPTEKTVFLLHLLYNGSWNRQKLAAERLQSKAVYTFPTQ